MPKVEDLYARFKTLREDVLRELTSIKYRDELQTLNGINKSLIGVTITETIANFIGAEIELSEYLTLVDVVDSFTGKTQEYLFAGIDVSGDYPVIIVSTDDNSVKTVRFDDLTFESQLYIL